MLNTSCQKANKAIQKMALEHNVISFFFISIKYTILKPVFKGAVSWLNGLKNLA